MEYTIKKGDTLWAIAKANNTTVDALAKANNISNPNLIYAGNTLTIPGSDSVSSSGSASSGSASSGVKASASSASSSKPVYTASSDVTAAKNALTSHESSKPAAYSSKYEGEISQLLDSILNREAFSYDYSSDPLYNAYKDSYTTLGRLAMEDTVGEASSLTGGYASSYAQSAGQQAYQSYLTQLTGIIPTLMEAAYNRYENEGDKLSETLSLLRSLDEGDYSKYRDTVSDYYNDGDYLLDKYSTLSDEDYKKFSDLLSSWQKEQEAAAEASRFETEMAYKAERDKVSDEQWEKNYALSLAKAQSSSSSSAKTSTKSSSSSSSTSASSSGSSKTYLDYEDFCDKAKELADLLTYPSAFLADGTAKPAIISGIKKARQNKEISYDEYTSLMNMINR